MGLAFMWMCSFVCSVVKVILFLHKYVSVHCKIISNDLKSKKLPKCKIIWVADNPKEVYHFTSVHPLDSVVKLNCVFRRKTYGGLQLSLGF